MAHLSASLIDLYLHTKFHLNRRNSLWTDRCTYGRTYIQTLRLALLGPLGGVDLKTEFGETNARQDLATN